MLLAIDAGNTHTVFGLWREEWLAVWRMKTDASATEDQIASFYFSLCKESGIQERPKRAVCANVVPALSDSLRLFAERWLHADLWQLSADTVPDLEIQYTPRSAVGADRLANAIAAKAKYSLPAIVVDFGTATTFDAIGSNGEYLGGSILPGPLISMEALFTRAAKLPKVELAPPKAAIGTDTQGSLQSGLVLGYAGAVDALVGRMASEMESEPAVVATGGLAELYAPVCESIRQVDPLMTLDGLRLSPPK